MDRNESLLDQFSEIDSGLLPPPKRKILVISMIMFLSVKIIFRMAIISISAFVTSAAVVLIPNLISDLSGTN